MEIAPIKTQRDYRRLLEEIEGLMYAKRNTAEGDRLDVLVTLVEAWEAKHYPLGHASPVEALRVLMEERGLRQRDLIPIFGASSVVSDVLKGKRSISKVHARKLAEFFHVPVGLFI